MGSGIAAMHYIGMAAMRLPAAVQWSPLLIGVSIVIAIAVSAVALWLAFRFGHAASPAWGRQKGASAAGIGLPTPTLHSTPLPASPYLAPRPAPPHPPPSPPTP